MALRKEQLGDYDHPEGFGEAPTDDVPVVFHLPITGVAGEIGLEEKIGKDGKASAMFERLHMREKGIMIRGLVNEIEIHVFKNKLLAEAALAALGIGVAVFLLSKSEAGKWTLEHSLHPHIRHKK